ncbi:hypothetical protein ACSSS7_002687 [Eimeria intestinalis]
MIHVGSSVRHWQGLADSEIKEAHKRYEGFTTPSVLSGLYTAAAAVAPATASAVASQAAAVALQAAAAAAGAVRAAAAGAAARSAQAAAGAVKQQQQQIRWSHPRKGMHRECISFRSGPSEICCERGPQARSRGLTRAPLVPTLVHHRAAPSGSIGVAGSRNGGSNRYFCDSSSADSKSSSRSSERNKWGDGWWLREFPAAVTPADVRRLPQGYLHQQQRWLKFVMVISGQWRSRVGRILQVDKMRNAIAVEGVKEGREVRVAGLIHVSNAMLLDPLTQKPTRLALRRDDKGLSVRISRRSGVIVPWPDASLVANDMSRGSVEYLRIKQQQQQQRHPQRDIDTALPGPKDTSKEKALEKSYDYAKVPPPTCLIAAPAAALPYSLNGSNE